MAFIYNMVDTWNNIGTTFNAIYMNISNGSGGAPVGAAGSRVFRLDSNSSEIFGITISGQIEVPTSFLVNITGNGRVIGASTSKVTFFEQLGNATVFIANSNTLSFGADGTTADTFLCRDAANILAQRNGANAQTFRVYGTFTDASTYERLTVGWTAGVGYISTEAAGGGTVLRSLYLNGADINFQTVGSTRWSFNGSGHFLAVTDNTYDIGASGATRPKDLYIAGKFTGQVMTISSLPTPASAGQGARLFVTNANAPVFAVSVVSGGTVNCPVYSDGSTWRAG